MDTEANDVENQEHYIAFNIQPIEYILANNLNYCEANVIKYVTRHGLKNGVEDINKAIRYLEIIKENQYGYDRNVRAVSRESGAEEWTDAGENACLPDDLGC